MKTYLTLIYFALSTIAFANIGDSKQDSEAKYGKAIVKTEENNSGESKSIYKNGDILVCIIYVNDKSMHESYGDWRSLPLTKEQIRDILNTYHKTWLSPQDSFGDGGIGIVSFSEDGMLASFYGDIKEGKEVIKNILIVCDTNYLVKKYRDANAIRL